MQRILTFLILSLTLLIAGCGTETIDDDKLVTRNAKTYKINSETPFTGSSVAFWPNGQKSDEQIFKKGECVKWTHWTENGQKTIEKEWGGETNTHIKWDEDSGQLMSEERFDESGQQSGTSNYWHPNGKISRVEEYSRGELNGYCRTYDDGELIFSSQMRNGVADGEVIEYYAVMNVEAIEEWDKNHGKRRITQNYKDGKLHGLTIHHFYDPPRHLVTEYKDGERVGEENVPKDGSGLDYGKLKYSLAENLFFSFISILLFLLFYIVPWSIWIFIKYFFLSRQPGRKAWLLKAVPLLAAVSAFIYWVLPVITRGSSLFS